MDKKIQVRIDTVTDLGCGSSIEVFVKLADFESAGPSIRSDIRRFKEDDLEMVRDAGGIGTTRGVPTMERWPLCKMMSDFNLMSYPKIISAIRRHSQPLWARACRMTAAALSANGSSGAPAWRIPVSSHVGTDETMTEPHAPGNWQIVPLSRSAGHASDQPYAAHTAGPM